MNLTNLKNIFQNYGCTKIYAKVLAPNDNSKNQVYLGGNFELLNIFPLSDIKTHEAGDWERERFTASIKFSWIGEEGNLYPAPKAQLILYPKYPEVRFSGFLLGCNNAPSDLMTTRLAGRILFTGISRDGIVIGYVTGPDSEITHEFNLLPLEQYGVFKILELNDAQDDKSKLISELRRIHELSWIYSKRLDRDGNIIPCNSPNCGGYTLEAELGITPNGYSEPDYLGWEIKQFTVPEFTRIKSSTITLMTPEPTDGIYKAEGTEYFLRKYGYPDMNGKEDRINFGGIYKSGKRNERTNLELKLIGFDFETEKIRNTNGRIALLDHYGNEAASWSFSSMLSHWNRKHSQACYVPSMCEKINKRKYKYGHNIIFGTGTDFQIFLSQMAIGNIYYDPGIKMEKASSIKPNIKKRSQFRIKSAFLGNLYKCNEIVDILI